MERTALIFYLIAAALSVRAGYETLPVETDEAMGEFIRFESRTWAAEMSGEGGRLAASATWTGEHVILNDVYVPSGVTLTLGPGAKVKFCTGTRIKVEDGGAIVLNGAEGEEVVLTGFADDTTFAGIVLQSSSASYSDNGYVVADGFAFGKFATVSLSDTTAFAAGGQAIIPVSVSGSRESTFSFGWVAETNGVAFASGTMSWSRVGDGTKNIIVPFGPEFASLSNFTVRASLLRCCNASKSESVVTLSEFITSDIQTDEAMGDFIRFESREWTTSFDGMPNTEGGRLTANTVWSNEHVIVSSVYIPSGVTLTLTADTVVRFCEGTMIKIEDGGKLEIVGADGHDVILRGYEDGTKYTGIVKMSSGTLTDNSYVRVDGFTLGTLANVALNNSSSFRSSGLALIPVTVSGSRDSSFSIDWVAETNGAPYKSGTMLWNRVSDGTKNISISYGAELDGLDKFTIRVVVHRACYANPDSCEVKISDFIVADIQTDEAMGEFIRFESRDWTTNFTDVANAEGGRLAANTTWTGEHVILNDVYIPSGVTLTLAADALVRFCEGTMIKIEDGGALNIVGAEGHDVIIRNYDGSTNSRGIVKMSSGTYTDNMYVQYPDFRYGNYPDITLHDAGVGRDAGKIYIPITLSGASRNQSFNVDWETDKGASGTISWSQSSEGTKWIEIPVDAATFGGTETYGIRLTAARGANLAVADAKVTIYEFNHPVTETVSLTEGTEPSNEFAVNGDIREQPIFLNEVEPVRYSGKWQTFDASEAAKLRVSIESDNGVKVLKEAGVDETGEFAFRPEDYPVGHYTLKHEIVDKVGDPLASMSKTFSVVDREDVVMHGGTLTSNEIWKAGMTHVVYAPVSVPSIYTLFIEPGAIVKFLTGTGIDLQTGAALFANAIVFTHIDDDTVGGDTLSDGYTVAPPMDAYYLTGNFTFGDDAELRNITQKTALTGTLNGNKMLSKGSTYRVSGTFTIANGATLTIPAGTILKMENNAAIVVNSGGVLNANGTRAAPVVITSINDDSYSGATEGSNHNPQPGDWSKIGINGGRANLDHTYVLYSSRNSTTGAINMNGGRVVFCNGVISHGKYDAVGVESGNFFMTNSVISDCLLAFRHWARDPIVNCIIYDCGRLTQGGSQNFVNCIFSRISETWEAFGFPQGTTYRNCCFWNEGGSVLTGEGTQDAMTVCGQNGNVWGDPLFVDPENGDFRIVASSPCVDAADSSVAPELDFYGQPRVTLTEQTNDTPVVQGQLADIGICEVMPRDVTSDIDLQPVSVRAEEKATPGQLIFVKWTVSNVGGVEVDGSWRDTISLVSENGQQVVLGDKITTSHIAVGGEVFCSAYFTVPAMAEGKWRLKVNINSYHDIFEGSLFANNALTSDRTVEISMPSIDPAQGATDGVINAGVPKVLKLTFAEGEENRMVHLDVPAGVKVAYGFGFMPRGNAASGSIIAGDAGVRFRVPEDATDVYVTLESDETATYELSYSKDKIVIASVTPGTLPSSGQVTVTITGAGFTSESQVEFVKGGMLIVPLSVQYVNSATLAVTVDCTKFVAGAAYDVRVLNGEDAFSAEGVITVAAFEGKGVLELSYDIPNSARAGRTFTFNVTCKNTGTSDMCCPLIAVEDVGNRQKGIAFSVDGVTFRDRGIQFVTKNSAGSFDGLKPGETVTFRVFARMPTSGLGKSAVLVRANSEVDAMSDCRNEVERYLSCADAGDTSDRIAKRQILLGSTNGEMVKSLSGVANRFLLCNGYALQEVQDLIGYGIACLDEPDGNVDKTSGKKQLQSAVLLGSSNTKPTGVYVYKNGEWVSILSENFDFANKSVAIISHGLDDGFGQGTWLGDLASALLGTHDFEDVLCVHWENEAAANWDKGKILSGATVGAFLSGNLAGIVAGGGVEAVAILREVSGRIPQVCRLAANQLEGRHLDASKSTFIGHSFGSHLLGYLAKHHVGVVKRHIGLDTAAAVALDSSIAIDGSCAMQTEFYRSSLGSGQENPYATYNYAVLKVGGFDAFSQVVGGNAFTGYHSYAWQWFIDNVKYGKTYKIGYWSDFGGLDCLKTGSGYRGVILGPQQRFECVYPYAQSNFGTVNYPGNKGSWFDLRRAWNDVADLHVDADKVSLRRNEVMYTGIPTKISVPVFDLCQNDVYSITRDKRPVQLRVSIGRADGTGRDEEVYSSLYRYDMTFNDCDIVVNDKIAETIGEDAVLKFSVDRYELDFMRDDIPAMLDLHPDDNSCSIPVKLKKGDGPQANINGHESCGFVIPHVKRYRSPEEYQNAVKENKTFVFNWDGSGSRCRAERKIIRYAWREDAGDEAVSEKAVFAREYYEFSQGYYFIALSVQDDLGKWSTVYGYLQNVVIIGEGEPIEEPKSVDPNEMVGPMGKGDPETERFVKPGEWMTYTVYFENQSNATAAAQEVFVSNPLSEWLDWSTFEMGEVAFNNQIDLGLVGKRNGTSEVEMNGSDYVVRSNVALDTQDGTIDWYLRIVDPNTETGWPEDVFAGFLPPNDETFRGEGHLTYRIKVREDAPKGVRIDNSATIVFDYNPPIETDPAWWNTVYAGGEAAFDAEEMTVDEGGTMKVIVNGGNADLASSVQVQVMYNTAAAADLDLKNATVNGVKPKNFKFPVTLEWAVGEIGEKTVEIPVIIDKAVEADEFLTLQLANPMNMEIGEASACTVTIHDPQFDALKAAVESGTATKAQSNDLQKIEKALAGKSYVRALANDATRGKVTGSVLAADGKKVTLKATANKGFVFAGWYTDEACAPGSELQGYGDYRNPSLAYVQTNGAVTVYARFVMPEEDSLSLDDDFLPAEFAVNKEVSIAVPVESVSYPTVTVSGLPSGLKYYAKETLVKATKTTGAYTIPANTIFGTPTKATTKPAMVTVTVKNLGGYQITRKYEVSVVATAPSTEKAKVVSDAPHYSSVAVDLSDDFAGKVTGAGVYQAGKKVTLKATANKGYVFAGWYEGVVDGGHGVAALPSVVGSAPRADRTAVLSQAASYVLTMPSEDVAYEARFVTAEEDKVSIGATVADFAFGAAAEGGGSTGLATNVMCGVYLEWPVAASAFSETTVKVAGLPSGLKFTAKPVTSKVGSGKTAVTVTNVPPNTIYGAPSAASKTAKAKDGAVTVKPSEVKVTVTTAGKNTQTYQIDMTVDPLPSWAVGTFAGPSYDGDATNGVATVTVAASGKISAKQPVNGKATSFTANYFDVYDIEQDAFWATLAAKVGKETVTNEMVVCGHAGRVIRPDGSDMAVTNGVIAAERFDAWQYNWKVEPWKAIGKSFDKQTLTYYVAADGTIVGENDETGFAALGGGQGLTALPVDGMNVIGRMSLKFAASGAVTVAGEFATGEVKNGKPVVVKATGSATLLPTVGEDGETRYLVFVYLAPKGLPPHARCFEMPSMLE